MKFINLTFKKFPADTADAIYVRELSRGFTRVLGKDFLLVVGKDSSEELKEIPHHVLGFKRKSFRTFYYFFWIPVFVAQNLRWGKGVVFFSNDYFLLASLVIWRKVFCFSYKICTDWHMIIDDWKNKFIARESDFHITTTEHLKNQLVDRFAIPFNKVKTVYGGVKEECFLGLPKEKLREKLSLPLDGVLFGYVGFFRTLGMEKGVRTILESLQFLKNEERVTAILVGGTEEEIREYEAYAASLGVGDRCIFRGRVSLGDVAKYQQALDILVIPYPDKPHFRKYGFPMKTYEYMASGVSVVYSDLPIIREVFGEYGFSFEPDSPSSLADVVRHVLMDSEEAQYRAEEAQKKVKSWTWNHKAEEIIQYTRI